MSSPEPTSHLTYPQPVDPVPDLAEAAIGFPQYLSPTYYLGTIAEKVLGVNPWQWVGDQWGGDWQAVQRAASSLRNLAAFETDFAGLVSADVGTVRSTWHGNAALAAQTYFSGLTDAVRDQVPTLTGMAADLDQTVIGMYETATAVKGIMDQLSDLLIAAAAEATAGAVLAGTGVGALAFAAAFAITAAKATSVYRALLDAHTAAWNAAQALVGVMAGYLGTLDQLELHPLPSAAYDHPGV